MYKILNHVTAEQHFTDAVRDKMFNTVAYAIKKKLKDIENPKHQIVGGMALGGIPLKDGTITNVWIEFNATIQPHGIADAGIHNIIIYDGDIPDCILDRYNVIKTEIKNITETDGKI